ncbi:hypothetical protein GX563_03760 [Candidatus Bathyarchaeota archaeon]|nr:hypothetical protein [Candidatus Bathyarchaeota archaeon]
MGKIKGSWAFVLIAVIGIVILTIGIVYSVVNSMQSGLPVNVTITSFNLTGYGNPVGVVWNDEFALNYTNSGLTDANNVSITFSTNSPFQIKREISVFDPNYPHYYIDSLTMGQAYPLGTIKAGGYKEFHGEIWNNLDDSAKMGGYTVYVTLKSKDMILDQAQLLIPKLQTYNITCTYHQKSLESVDADRKVAFLVTANSVNGSQANLSFEKFYLNVMYAENLTTAYPVTRFYDAVPWETGTITLDTDNWTSDFQLTFQFPSYFKGSPLNSYSLVYQAGYSDSIQVIHEDLLDSTAVNK